MEIVSSLKRKNAQLVKDLEEATAAKRRCLENHERCLGDLLEQLNAQIGENVTLKAQLKQYDSKIYF